MSKIIYVLIAILIYMIINLFIVIKKNTKILHFAGSILFLQVFLLSVVNSHFITLSEYSVCEYIFLFCMTIYAILVYFLLNFEIAMILKKKHRERWFYALFHWYRPWHICRQAVADE